ncbi:MAG: hypothetical protein GXO96_05530 [Nitrospirae bacterium]|nr:hypothetical protein [Candidatus Manganitrophaceae bacterium]
MHEEQEIDLLTLWKILLKRRRFLFLTVGAVFIFSVIFSFSLPNVYQATTSLLQPQETSAAEKLIASQIPSGLVGLAGGALGMKSQTNRWMGILNSRTVFDQIITRFDLQTVYDKETVTETRLQLEKAVHFQKSREGILSISLEDQDPERAAAMANAFVEVLDKINREIVMTSGGRTRAFIEGRLEEAKTALEQSEEALKVFQEKNGAVKLDAQSEAMIDAMGAIQGKLLSKEVALKTLLSYATPQNPQVTLLKTEITELKRALLTLERGNDKTENTSNGLFIPTNRLPDLGLQYLRLLRDVKIDETLYGLLTEQYEIARIQEAKDSSTVQVLDFAIIPEKPVKPKKQLIVISATMLAGLLAFFGIFFLEYLETAKINAQTKEQFEKTKIDLIRKKWRH